MRPITCGIVLSLLSSLLPVTALGQVTIGSLPNNAISFFPSSPYSVIDLGHPAPAAGTVTTATVRWFAGSTSCSAAFRIKVLRPLTPFGTYVTVADRGPFNSPATDSYVAVTLSPAVAVQRGDLLAVVQLKPTTTCGAAMFAPEKPERFVVNFDGDVPPVGAFVGGDFFLTGALAARAAGDANVLDGIVAVAGSVTGTNSSFFRTSMQLSNPDDAPIHGKIVFHPAGATASSSDRSTPYNLQPHASLSFPDVVAALNASGLGSIDVVSASSAPPVVPTRIFNDLGADGTSGFTEPLLPPRAALGQYEIGVFSIAPDLTNDRMNVGIRTLGDGAQISIRQFDVNGAQIGSPVTRSYAPSFFEQTSLSAFLGGQTPLSGSLVRISVVSGSIIVYASTTDNHTNDSSVFFVSR